MTVVPDSIEPVEEWRTWMFHNDRLVSHNGTAWEPGEAQKAKCVAANAAWVWTIVRGGWSREQAAERAQQHNATQRNAAMFSTRVSQFCWLSTPSVEPPDGYGYTLEAVQHHAPDPDCSCGIYAGHSLSDCPPGDVVGKVKMWGTIVPGSKGSRAEYAYPSELHVPERLANDPALLAYGVPIVALTEQEIAAAMPTPTSSRWPWPLRVAFAMNAAACIAQLAIIGVKAWT